MLGSWLRPPPLTQENGEVEYSEDERPLHKPKYRSLIPNPDAPHNAVLNEVHGQHLDTSPASPKAPHPNNSTRKEVFHKPASGEPVEVVPISDPYPRPQFPGSINSGEENEELWSHLSAVLELQADIARKHHHMEGPSSTERKKRQSTKPTQMWDEARRNFIPSGHAKMSETLSSGIGEEDPSGKVENVEEIEIRKREDEFSKLADHFEGKKDSIDDIMGKVSEFLALSTFHADQYSQLDSLSSALTKFHALQVSKNEFPGLKQNSNPPMPRTTRGSSGPAHVVPSSPTSHPPASPPTASDALQRHPYPLLLNTMDIGQHIGPVDSPVSTVTSLVLD